MKKYLPSVLLPAILIFILTFPDIGYPVKATLDGGYQYALNIIFTNRLKVGIDYIFSFGPLGFLHYPQPIGANLAIGIIFWAVIKFLFIAGLLLIVFFQNHRKDLLIKILLVFLFANIIDIWSLPTFLLVELLLLHKIKGKPFFLFAAVFLTSLTFLIKLNYLLVNTSILAVYSIFLFARKPKGNWRILMLIILLTILCFVVFWLLSESSFVYLPTYLRGMLEISRGNSSAMAVSPPNNWSLLGAFLLLFVAQPFFIGNKEGFFLFLLLFTPFLATWKYTFMREDTPHLYYLVDYVIYYYLMLLVFAKKIHPMGRLIMMLSIILLLVHMTLLPKFGDPNLIKNELERMIKVSGHNNFRNQVINYPSYRVGLLNESSNNMKSFQLEEDIKQIIGKGTIDVYPWDLAYIYANVLTFRPKPILQTYVAFTPWLDAQDANFYRSPRAPDYLLWTRVHWGGETGSIDGRYLLNDEPQALMEIMQNYKPIKRGGNTVLWQRDGIGLLSKGSSIFTSFGRWGEWVNVPDDKGGIIRANIKLHRTRAGSLIRVLWKEDESYIEYKTSLKIYSYRLVPDNAISGLWMSPYLAQLDIDLKGEKVQAVRLIHKSRGYYKQNIEFEWIFYPLKAS
ncbi:MAG: hypothetical protein UV73_C0005G0061 [Candidatus Gottesmanbacteria bacterium GW2011_GWA2_43_14]|uniref:Glycosyltransferase RgtA/B/C/D-like domain-containing protein n=1 Tax=Candidatus Gottesmanbacteria bacterium GW2011_GWA2_43_14 TaxID=1618443 RepID=A0A0G1DJG3_9BACT|nr:MAG: hypothetical protein UV73_C0005G0061 [Candidatus Gottesmanbacteria bacterium GW2011_GWA2_43_14]